MLYRASNTINPDGTYQGQLVYEAAKGHVFSAKTGDSVTNEEQTTLYANSLSRIEAATAGQGMLYRANNSINPDGTYQGQLISDKAKPLSTTAVATEESSSNSTTTEVRINQTSAITASAVGQAAISRASNSINPDGTFNGAVVVETSKPLSTTAVATEAGIFVTKTTDVRINQTSALTAVSSSGTIGAAANSINPDGTFNGSLVVATAVSVSEPSRTSAIADDYQETTEREHNAASIPSATGGANQIVTVDGSLNEFGKYDYVKRVRTVQVPTSSSGATWTELGTPFWETLTTYVAGDVAELGYASTIRQMQRTDTHVVSFHLTAAAAAGAATGGMTGSGISRVTDFLWMAHKVTHSYATLSTFSLAAPKTTRVDSAGVDLYRKVAAHV
jgi:hypothetical protein